MRGRDLPVNIRSAHLRLYLPFLNAHGRHTCLSLRVFLQSTWVPQRLSHPSNNRSFARQACAKKAPGDLIPARGVTAERKRV